MRFFLPIAAIVLISCATQAQPTHQIGNTTLTETNLVTGIFVPWEILWGPDDHIWCTERRGKILRIEPQSGNVQEVLDLMSTVNVGQGSSGERGMMGMAMHPDWENTPRVFVVHNYVAAGGSHRVRLVAFDWNGTALVNQQTLLENIHAGNIHSGSRLLITTDNKILMTTGDGGQTATSQNMNSTGGKTLRLNLDGSIPSDNPFPDSYVYSFGHRNAQGLCYGPNGIIYSSEHGPNVSDEFNIILEGRNYGWPNVEGACNTAAEITFCEANNVVEPLAEWSPCVAVNGIEYYNHPAIPEWQNSVLMAVLGGLGGQYKRLTVLHMSADGQSVESQEHFFQSFGQRLRDVCVNPYTGAVYIATNGSSYPGAGPNMIKEFRNMAYNSVHVPNKPTQTIEVFPNPSSDRVTFTFSKSFVNMPYEIINFNGQTAKQGRITGEQMTFDKAQLPAGTYFLRAVSPKGMMTRTFIMQ
jgi:aldose sugar dehydrogenase